MSLLLMYNYFTFTHLLIDHNIIIDIVSGLQTSYAYLNNQNLLKSQNLCNFNFFAVGPPVNVKEITRYKAGNKSRERQTHKYH